MCVIGKGFPYYKYKQKKKKNHKKRIICLLFVLGCFLWLHSHCGCVLHEHPVVVEQIGLTIVRRSRKLTPRKGWKIFMLEKKRWLFLRFFFFFFWLPLVRRWPWQQSYSPTPNSPPVMKSFLRKTKNKTPRLVSVPCYHILQRGLDLRDRYRDRRVRKSDSSDRLQQTGHAASCYTSRKESKVSASRTWSAEKKKLVVCLSHLHDILHACEVLHKMVVATEDLCARAKRITWQARVSQIRKCLDMHDRYRFLLHSRPYFCSICVKPESAKMSAK